MTGAQSWRPHDPERGAASVLALAVIAVIVVSTGAVLVLASAVAASHRARLAADLSAVAAARTLQLHGDAGLACAAAGGVARANRAELTGCSTSGGQVTVSTRVRPAVWPEPALARARAGPGPP